MNYQSQEEADYYDGAAAQAQAEAEAEYAEEMDRLAREYALLKGLEHKDFDTLKRIEELEKLLKKT